MERQSRERTILVEKEGKIPGPVEKVIWFVMVDRILWIGKDKFPSETKSPLVVLKFVVVCN